MSKRLIECYKTFLESLSMEVGSGGEVSLVNPETKTKEPFFIKGRRLILPTREFLRMEDRSEYQPFHPLSENLARGQSVVVKSLARTIHKLLLWNMFELTNLYMEVACTREYQKNLPSVWNNFFQATKDGDAKTLENFRRILKAGCDDHKRLGSIFLKNGSKIDGKKYSRVCHVGFSWFDDIDSQLVFGVKIRKKDVDVIKAVLKQVLPGIDVKDYYSAGTNVDVAPYFVALMESWGKIASDFNNAIAMATVVETHAHHIPVEFMERLKDLPSMYRDVPPLDGNEGEPLKHAVTEDAVERSTQHTPPPWDTNEPAEKRPAPSVRRPQQQQVVQQQQQQSAPATSDFRSPYGQQTPIQPQMPMQQMPQSWMPQQQQMGYNQPMQQQYPMQTQQGGGLGSYVGSQGNMYAQQLNQPMQQMPMQQQQMGYNQPMQQQGYVQSQPMQQGYVQPQQQYGMPMQQGPGFHL